MAQVLVSRGKSDALLCVDIFGQEQVNRGKELRSTRDRFQSDTSLQSQPVFTDELESKANSRP